MAMTSAPLLAPGEGDLLIRAQRGDDGARSELARAHRRATYVLALQLTGNADDALDISQEAMVRLFGNLERLDRGRSIRPWLFTVVRNLARDLWRRQKVRKNEPLAVEVGTDLGHQIVDPTDGPESRAAAAETRRRLWDALATLSPGHREILVLRDYHDLSYEELAEVLAIPLGTVMSRLHSARRNLRPAYLEIGGATDV